MSKGEKAPEKKGLPVWAWIGIGCGAMIVLAMILVTVGGYLVSNKVKDVAADFEENPAMATARMIVKLNPELEEVSTDEEEGTITVRNTETGEEITVNFEDIEDGKFSFKAGDREVNIDASDLDEGNLKVTDGDDNVVYSAGKVSEDVPEWVPLYPDTEPTNRHTMKAGGESSGGFEIETAASVDEVLEFYRSTLEGQGYTVSVNTYSQDQTSGGMVNGSHGDAGRNVIAIVSSENDGPTKVGINFSERQP